jgi:oligopeptide transport system substrate-binding protein
MKNFISILSIFIIVSCSNGKSPVEEGLENQILHWGNGSEPQGIDPHIVTGVPEHHILIGVCEGLTITDPKGGRDNLPGVAESWTLKEDQKTYVFNFNPNARWSNGDRVTPEDFVWSWQRALTPTLGSQYSEMLFYVKNAKKFYDGEINDFSEVGVKAISDYELEVELENQTPFFVGLLAHYSTWPVHKETVLKFGEMDDRSMKWTRPGNHVCNGPMKLKSWELNKKIVVEKNEFYWDADRVKLNEIHYYPIQNESTEDRMFRAGALHITNVVPQEKCPVYLENKNPSLRIDPYMGTYYYRVNTTLPHLSDSRVRKALAMGINRKLIVEKVSKCGQKTAYSFTPPGTSEYYPDTVVEFNPEKAKELLTEAGYPDGDGFPTIEILFNTQEGHRKIAEVIQQMWKVNLGINVEIYNTDSLCIRLDMSINSTLVLST